MSRRQVNHEDMNTTRTDTVYVDIDEKELWLFLNLKQRKRMETVEKYLRCKLDDNSVSLAQGRDLGRVSLQLEEKLLQAFLEKLHAKKNGHPWSTERDLLKQKVKHLKEELAEVQKNHTSDNDQCLEAQMTAHCKVTQNPQSSDCDGLQEQLMELHSEKEQLKCALGRHRAALQNLSKSIRETDKENLRKKHNREGAVKRMWADHQAQLHEGRAKVTQLEADLKASQQTCLQLLKANKFLSQDMETSRVQYTKHILEQTQNLKELERRLEEQDKKLPPLQEINIQLVKEQEPQEEEEASRSTLNFKESSSASNEAYLQENKDENYLKEGDLMLQPLQDEEEVEDKNKTSILEDLQSPLNQKEMKRFRRWLARLRESPSSNNIL